jgi:hypothetical protein
MAPHTVAYFSYEHRVYPQFDPRQVIAGFTAACDATGCLLHYGPLITGVSRCSRCARSSGLTSAAERARGRRRSSLLTHFCTLSLCVRTVTICGVDRYKTPHFPKEHCGGSETRPGRVICGDSLTTASGDEDLFLLLDDGR